MQYRKPTKAQLVSMKKAMNRPARPPNLRWQSRYLYMGGLLLGWVAFNYEGNDGWSYVCKALPFAVREPNKTWKTERGAKGALMRAVIKAYNMKPSTEE